MSGRESERLLAALAAGLSQDADIRIEVRPGREWAWVPAERTIRVGGDDLEARGPLYCAGILAHEVAHFFVSRYVDFKCAFRPSSAASFLLNAIEDPRANTWSRRRYPGTGAWLAEAAGESEPIPTDVPAFVVFCLECAREETRDWLASDEEMSDRVREALDETRDARRAYAETLPAPDLQPRPDRTALALEYRGRVTRRLRRGVSRVMPSAWEQEVRLSALDAHELAEARIIPIARSLYRRDAKKLARFLRDHPRARRAVRPGPGLPGLSGSMVVQAAMQAEGQKKRLWVPPSCKKLAEQLLEQALGRQDPHAPRRRLGPGMREEAPSRPARSDPSDPIEQLRALMERQDLALTPVSYARVLEDVRLQVDDLAREVERILPLRQRTRRHPGYPSGTRVDLRRLMRYEADPRRAPNVWSRTTKPHRASSAFSLLVDLSGSMRGPKARAATRGSVLLVETLDRLAIPFALNGFQDELIDLIPFDQPLCEDARKAVEEIPLEIAGRRPRGHNRPKYNDDGPCLLDAAASLRVRPEHDRFLIVISDGLPEGSRSTPEDLSEAIAALGREKPGMELIGIGLGPGTEHVSDYYPQSVACVPHEELVGELAGILRQALLGPR